MNTNISSVVNEINNTFNTFISKINEPFEQFNKSIEEINDKAEQFHKFIEETNDKLPAVLKKLMKCGWYFDINMQLSWIHKLERDLKEPNNIELIEQLFEMYFDKNINNIKNNVISKYTNREHILEDAFKAHKQGKYNLSVPIFLIQIDGIFKEITCGENFFMNNNKNKINKFINENDIDGFSKIFFNSLKQKASIDNHVNEETKIPNRHYILHGNALKYGTKRNSLKGISLLNYIVELSQK